ncbi:MAG: ECF transporter S component [Firmicutes bacterium]|nr:ECF transporter S component [Bacillota bacterium]
MQKKNGFPLKRLVFDAVLMAVFFALSRLSVTIYGVKLTFDSLAVVICAMLFGPVDAFLVGFLGEFLSQLLGQYGLTATTLLWVLPPALRGLIVGLAVVLLKKSMSLDTIIHKKRPYVYYIVCIVAAVLTSLGNTAAYYVDSKMFGYYNYALIFGVLGVRILSGILSALLTATAALPILIALQRANLIPTSRQQETNIKEA